MIVIGAKQPKKEIKKSEVIYTEMAEKEIDKPSQVGESQLSLTTIVAMLGVRKEWEDVRDQFLIAVNITPRLGNPTTKEVYPIVGGE